jgi:hypothetical protein
VRIRAETRITIGGLVGAALTPLANTITTTQTIDLGSDVAGLIVEANAPQNQPLTRWRNSGGGTTYAEIDKLGRFGLGANYDNAPIRFDSVNRKIPCSPARQRQHRRPARSAAGRLRGRPGDPGHGLDRGAAVHHHPQRPGHLRRGSNKPQGVATLSSRCRTRW